MYLFVKSIDFASFYGSGTRLWNCFDRVVCFVCLSFYCRRYDITEILLKVTFNIINPPKMLGKRDIPRCQMYFNHVQ